jgi:hypothetical protein
MNALGPGTLCPSEKPGCFDWEKALRFVVELCIGRVELRLRKMTRKTRNTAPRQGN